MTDKEKLDIALMALKEIEDPISFMRAALEKGQRLDGLMAVTLSQDPYYLKEIAKKAITKIEGGK